MKFLFAITLVGFFTLNLSAQSLAMVNPDSPTKATVSAEKKALIKRHTNTAAQQIHVHLQKNLDYTPTMEEYNVEGALELVVVLKPNGQIASLKMKGEQSPILSYAVKEAMRDMDKILFHGIRYEGASEIRVPIKFMKY